MNGILKVFICINLFVLVACGGGGQGLSIAAVVASVVSKDSSSSPTLSIQGASKSYRVDDPWEITFSTTGLDSATVVYSIEKMPDWMELDTTNGKLHNDPDNVAQGYISSPGEFNLVVKAVDGANKSAEKSFSFTIRPWLADVWVFDDGIQSYEVTLSEESMFRLLAVTKKNGNDYSSAQISTCLGTIEIEFDSISGSGKCLDNVGQDQDDPTESTISLTGKYDHASGSRQNILFNFLKTDSSKNESEEEFELYRKNWKNYEKRGYYIPEGKESNDGIYIPILFNEAAVETIVIQIKGNAIYSKDITFNDSSCKIDGELLNSFDVLNGHWVSGDGLDDPGELAGHIIEASMNFEGCNNKLSDTFNESAKSLITIYGMASQESNPYSYLGKFMQISMLSSDSLPVEIPGDWLSLLWDRIDSDKFYAGYRLVQVCDLDGPTLVTDDLVANGILTPSVIEDLCSLVTK